MNTVNTPGAGFRSRVMGLCLVTGLLLLGPARAQSVDVPPLTSPAIVASAQAPIEAQTETEPQVQIQVQIQGPIEGDPEINAPAPSGALAAPDIPAPEDDVLQATPGEPRGSSRVPSEPLTVTDVAMPPAARTDAAGTADAQPAMPAAVTPVPVAPEPRGERNLQTSLLIEVETVRQDMAVTVAIFGDADSFRSGEGPVRTLSLSQNRPVARAFVLNLPPGRYAIIAWQDLNGDGRPSRSRFGLTADPIGYSRAARAARGGPSFDDAAFDLGSAGLTQRIVLKGR